MRSPFTKPELLAVLKAALSDPKAVEEGLAERNWSMIAMAFLHGLRCSEVVSLHTANIVSNYLVLQRLKGSKKTTQLMCDGNKEALYNVRPFIQRLAAKGGYLYPGRKPGTHLTRKQFWRIVHRTCELAGIPPHKAFPHTLKHTLGHLTTRAGADVAAVQSRLGHVNGKNTLEYLKLTDEEADQVITAALA